MTIGPVGSRTTDDGTRIDGSVTEFWAKKAQAIEAAKAICWPLASVVKCHTRFQKGWALSWGIARPKNELVTRTEYAELLAPWTTEEP